MSVNHARQVIPRLIHLGLGKTRALAFLSRIRHEGRKIPHRYFCLAVIQGLPNLRRPLIAMTGLLPVEIRTHVLHSRRRGGLSYPILHRLPQLQVRSTYVITRHRFFAYYCRLILPSASPRAPSRLVLHRRSTSSFVNTPRAFHQYVSV